MKLLQSKQQIYLKNADVLSLDYYSVIIHEKLGVNLWHADCVFLCMKCLLKIILFAFILNAGADVLPYEGQFIRFTSPKDWVKSPYEQNGLSYYFNWHDKSQKVYVQLHRDRKWAQWHMQSLHQKSESFANVWRQDPALMLSGEPISVDYDPDDYVLTLVWRQEHESFLVSKMKLTSFGCVAFHYKVEKEQALSSAKNLLGSFTDSLDIPENLCFYPEDLASELLNNMGGAFAFIVLSMLYLMFSLFQRSQMRHRRLELSMQTRNETLHRLS